jgi:hypothetical protein
MVEFFVCFGGFLGVLWFELRASCLLSRHLSFDSHLH